MKAKDINRAIDMLRAYCADLQYWKDCGPENWMSCTCGTPAPYLNERVHGLESHAESVDKAESFMKDYITDVQQAIDDLTQLKETQSGETKVYELFKSYTVSEVYHVPADSLEQAIEIMDYDHKRKEYDGDYDTHPDGTEVVTGGGEWTREEYESEYGEIES